MKEPERFIISAQFQLPLKYTSHLLPKLMVAHASKATGLEQRFCGSELVWYEDVALSVW